MANPYDILGVPRDADDEAIKNAYRELVKQHHPDHGGDREKFNQIQEAYEQIKSGDVGREESNTSQQQVICSNCGKPRSTANTDFKDIEGGTYCEDCYVETKCNHCGGSITTKPEQYRKNNGDLYCADCIIDTHCSNCGTSLSVTPDQYEIGEDLYCTDCMIDTHCSNCGTSLSITPDQYEDGEDLFCTDCIIDTYCSDCGTSLSLTPDQYEDGEEIYCSDCLVETQCTQCGTELQLSEGQYNQLNQNPVCKDCGDKIDQNQSQSNWTRRRKILAVLGIFGTVRVGQSAFEEGYLSGAIGEPKPDIKEKQQLSLNNQYYAERFNAPEGARLEYDLTVVSGGMESHLYTATQYQKFKQGVEEESRYDRGEDIDKGSIGAGTGDRELSCELPKESKYALVFLPFVNEARGVLNYRVYS